jgi:hypothetical protein
MRMRELGDLVVIEVDDSTRWEPFMAILDIYGDQSENGIQHPSMIREQPQAARLHKGTNPNQSDKG